MEGKLRKNFLNTSFTVIKNPDPEKSFAGDLVIHAGVVATIVKRTVSGIQGISRFAGNSFLDNIAEIVRSKKIKDRSIEISFSEEGVTIGVSVFVFFGSHLPDIALQIQKDVESEVTKQTGLKVVTVNVNFRGIDEEPSSAEDDPQEKEV